MPHAFAVVISTETQSGFITEYHVFSVGLSPICPGSTKIHSTLSMIIGSVIGFLMDVGSLYQHWPVVSEFFLFIPPEAWKVVNVIKSILVAFFDKATHILS